MNTNAAMRELIRSTCFRFSDQAVAFAFASRSMMAVILGDDEKYWVVTLADGARLLRAGYEAA